MNKKILIIVLVILIITIVIGILGLICLKNTNNSILSNKEGKGQSQSVLNNEGFELIFSKVEKENNPVTTILDKSESDNYSYNIYAYNGNVNIKINGEIISLRKALLNNKITMKEIIEKAKKDLPDAYEYLYDDGGTIEYHYEDYTIIKLNKIDGNKDVYIGDSKTSLNDLNIKTEL